MQIYPSDDGRAALVRLARGSDLLASLTEAAEKLGITAGTVQAIGAVTGATLGYFNQEKKEYVNHRFEGGHEIASGVGNVSIRDGKTFVHFHLVASAPDGSAVGGHLMEGTKVFAVEAYLRALGGEAPVREADEDTGLALWT